MPVLAVVVAASRSEHPPQHAMTTPAALAGTVAARVQVPRAPMEAEDAFVEAWADMDEYADSRDCPGFKSAVVERARALVAYKEQVCGYAWGVTGQTGPVPQWFVDLLRSGEEGSEFDGVKFAYASILAMD